MDVRRATLCGYAVHKRGFFCLFFTLTNLCAFSKGFMRQRSAGVYSHKICKPGLSPILRENVAEYSLCDHNGDAGDVVADSHNIS